MTDSAGKEETRRSSRPLQESEGQPQAHHEPPRIGELVGGKYRISRLLAEGGMGVVYEAMHEIVRRRFAVKFLRSDYAHRREFLGRFKREAEAAGALESENIASAVDFGVTADGSPFIVMEYLVGEDLASLLRREGRLPLERAADLCLQACHGAEAAHAAGILHRDLKPKNLFIGRREDGTDLLKILDFGIAKLAPIRYDHSITDTGTVMGTPAYMSPEHARGEKTLDPRSDVYALGAILFEMVSGRLPHPGESPNAILHHISTRPAISLEDAAPGLPQPLVQLVDTALATEPGERPQSAKALAQEVAPFAKRQVWPGRPGAEGIDSQSGEVPAKILEARPHRWRRYLPLTVALALLAAGVVALASRSTKTSLEPMVTPPAPRGNLPTGSDPPPPVAAEPIPVPAAATSPGATGVPLTTERARPSGRPKGRPSGRPKERPAEPAKERPTEPKNEQPAGASDSSAPAGGSSQRTRESNPERDILKRKNPYEKR